MDLIRGAACLMILLYHLRFDRPVGLGQAAMEIFFVISGYLIARSLSTALERHGLRGVAHFAVRRVRRLMPAMLVFLIGALCLNLTSSALSWPVFGTASFFSIIGGYNFYQVYYSPGVIGLGGIWSLSLEEQFYVAAVLSMLAARSIGLQPATRLGLLAVLLLGCGFYFRLSAYLGSYKPGDNGHLPYLPPLRMWGFGLGVSVAWIETQLKIKATIDRLGQWPIIGLAAVAIGSISALITSVLTYNATTFMFHWAAVPMCAALLVLIAPRLDFHGERWNRALPASAAVHGFRAVISFLRIVGLASYSVYLWHCLAIAAFVRFDLHREKHAWVSMAALSIGLGLLSWKFVEKRFYDFRPLRSFNDAAATNQHIAMRRTLSTLR
jgi:peptidoglycan/LPS O-acetylase OafA/YrhL